MLFRPQSFSASPSQPSSLLISSSSSLTIGFRLFSLATLSLSLHLHLYSFGDRGDWQIIAVEMMFSYKVCMHLPLLSLLGFPPFPPQIPLLISLSIIHSFGHTYTRLFCCTLPFRVPECKYCLDYLLLNILIIICFTISLHFPATTFIQHAHYERLLCRIPAQGTLICHWLPATNFTLFADNSNQLFCIVF